MCRVIHLILVMSLAGWLPLGFAATVDERDIKAALIYNFAVYTSWPESTQHFFNICLVESDQESVNEGMLKSKTLNGKVVHVKHLRDIDDVKTCQILFMEEVSGKEDKRLLQLIKKHAVLFVHNGHQYIDTSMIRIELVDKRYHFSINYQVAKDANLTLSSKLLRLATRVN